MEIWSPPPPQVADILEAFYSVSLDERAWLQGAVDALAASLIGVLHVSGALYERTPAGAILPLWSTEWSTGKSQLARFATVTPAVAPAVVDAVVRRPLCQARSVLASIEPVARSQFEHQLRGLGIVDGWFLNSIDLEGPRVMLSAIMPHPILATEWQCAPWLQLASHLGVTLRLRRRLSAGVASAEAVLSPSGSLAHAEGPATDRDAREALQQATRAIDVARARLRRRPDEALAAWRAVVSGRWTLVEQFDTDGRRFMLARVNTTQAKGPRGLSEREKQACAFAAQGHSNKQIACELGVSLSTVAGHLKRASQKLGVRSRVELVQFWNSLG